MDYLESWFKNVTSRGSLCLNKELIFKKEIKKHVGPRCEDATVEVKIEPSHTLEIEISDAVKTSDDNFQEYLHSSIYGILDVLLASKLFPLKDVKITILNIKAHPVDSQPRDFRKVGRIIGREIMNTINAEE